MATTVQTRAAVQPAERHDNSKLTEGIYRTLLYGAVVLGGIVFAIPFYWMMRTSVMPTTQVYLFPPEW